MRYIGMTITGVVLLLTATQAYAAAEIECRSSGYHYQYCRADTDNRVQLIRRSSSSSCDYGRSWGYDQRGIWVDNGCAATFRYGRDRGGNDAAGIVAGAAAVAILGAMLSSNNDRSDHYDNPDRHDAGVPGWAVGRFIGDDRETGLEIELAIDRNGRIAGLQGSREFEGQIRGTQAWLGNRQYDVVRSGDGFRLVGEGHSGFDLYRN